MSCNIIVVNFFIRTDFNCVFYIKILSCNIYKIGFINCFYTDGIISERNYRCISKNIT